jgi:hypothetical protein
LGIPPFPENKPIGKGKEKKRKEEELSSEVIPRRFL